MRILFIGAHFPRPNNPLIGTWALSQVTALGALGHNVKVISPVPAIPLLVGKLLRRGTSAVCPPRHDWDGIRAEYLRWPVYPVGPLAKVLQKHPALFVVPAWKLSAARFLDAARSFDPQVIFAHHGQLSGYIAAQLARRLSVPYFVTEHNFNDLESCAHNEHRKRFYARMTAGISSWIAVANRMRTTMNDIFPEIPTETVHNGADPIPNDIRSTPRPETFANRLIVLCVAFLYKRKNVPLLVESFDRIAGKHPSALLMVIGDGEDKQSVAAAAGKAEHRSQIVLLGALGHREVLQYMVWCDVFANIAVNEPFGVVFSEAMMAGKPILFATDCGIADVAAHGVHGLAIEPSDGRSVTTALDQLLADANLRRRLGSSASALAQERLTWERNAMNMEGLFSTALDAHRPADPCNFQTSIENGRSEKHVATTDDARTPPAGPT